MSDTITPEEMALLLSTEGKSKVKTLLDKYCSGPLLQPLKQIFGVYLTALEAAEADGAKLREQVSALLELNDANMEVLVACVEEESAIADHDDSHAGRTPDTKLRLERVQASLVLAYDNVNNARAMCEALGLNVTPWQQGARDA